MKALKVLLILSAFCIWSAASKAQAGMMRGNHIAWMDSMANFNVPIIDAETVKINAMKEVLSEIIRPVFQAIFNEHPLSIALHM